MLAGAWGLGLGVAVACWTPIGRRHVHLPCRHLTLSAPSLPAPLCHSPCLQFWINSAPLPASPVRFDFEAENGMRVAAFSDDPLKSQELPNFE
jgi:hypothetical protein